MQSMGKLVSLIRAMLIVSVILGISGCATRDILTNDEKNTAYAQYIMTNKLESIKHIRAFDFRGWNSLTNEYMLISSSFGKRYLIELKGSCYDLDSSYTIALKQSMAGQLSINFDAIMVLNGFPMKCYINAIYPIEKTAAKELQAIGKEVKEQ